ncbi:30S ribosomal protein S20 [Massilibacterium senegalense]|uniref:30S ribosomal protein S20 n=1 Tax=Massilibacterium senegalense TaxID=1632858 RepID=UPI000781D69E|nr:30S ribosomal protein S20 [Massilibacterium senegalense]
MPNIKSAIKRVKINDDRRTRNIQVKSAMRTAIKRFEQTIEANDVEAAKAAFLEATKKVDKAVSKGILHKNTAARTKSKLATKLNGLSA